MYNIQFYSDYYDSKQFIIESWMKPNTIKAQDNSPINDFNGHYQFLNNDHPAWVSYESVIYPSANIAFHAARTNEPIIRQSLQNVESYQRLKEIALSIQNPSDWNNRRHRVMEKIIRDKFKRNKQLGGKLLATVPRTLINTYKNGGQSQLFWGVVEGKGSNTLGKILMSAREQIANGSDWQKWIFDQGIQFDEKKRAAVSLTIIKDDKPVDKLFLEKKGKFFFGNHQNNQIKLDHPSISKIHACIYFGIGSKVILIDLCSSNGTSLTRDGKTSKIDTMKPFILQKDDIIIFGMSSRKYRVDLDLTKVQEYLSSLQNRKQKSSKQLKSTQKRRSRSRSRSPRHKKSHR